MMKTRVLPVGAAILLAILLGANAKEIPAAFNLVFPPAKKAPLSFEQAHASLAIPVPDEAEMECKNGREHDIPVPDPLYLQDYEKVLYNFILRRQYVGLDWCVDKKVRDTGPWVEETYYGVPSMPKRIKRSIRFSR